MYIKCQALYKFSHKDSGIKTIITELKKKKVKYQAIENW